MEAELHQKGLRGTPRPSIVCQKLLANLSIRDQVLVDYANEVREAWKTMVRHYRVEDANAEPMITLSATDLAGALSSLPHQPWNSLAPCFRRREFLFDRRSCHIPITRVEYPIALRDQIIGGPGR